MGKQKSRSSRVSGGGRQKANVAREAKRQARFAAKREAGKAYKWEPISAKKGSKEYNRELLERAEKAKSSKLPLARKTSVMAKLNNMLNAEALKKKEAREKRENKQAK